MNQNSKITNSYDYLCGMRERHIAFLLTGGNIGDRFSNLIHAKNLIEAEAGPILASSGYYETKAWGKEDQADFLNQALKVETNLSPLELLNTLQDIEAQLGRVRNQKWDARIIDIDILLYDDLIMETDELSIPHKHIHERNFTLIPMMEIDGEKEHPILKKTIETLYWESKDTLEVYLLEML